VRRARVALLLVAAGLLAVAAGLALVRPPWGLETGPWFPAPDERPFRAVLWIALFWASLANAGLALVGAATAPRWARPLPPAPPWGAPPPLRTTAIVLLGLAALLAVGLRAPLASGSLWWDEIWSLTRVIRGELAPDPDEPTRLELEDRSWARTLWYYRKPTNHVAYNVAARTSLAGWRTLTGAPAEAFDEVAFRLPALVAAVLSVLAIGLLGWRAGFPRAGVAAAFLLAIHPWHIRYGVEGRAYSFLVLSTLLVCLGLAEALRSGRGRAFALAGAGILGLLWTHPFSAHFVLVLAPLGMLGVLRAPGGPARRRSLAWRWLATLALSGLVFAQVMAPNLAQSMTWPDVWNEDRNALRQAVDWWGETATGISVRCAPDDRPDDPYPCLARRAEAQPWVTPLVWGVLPLLAAFGLARVVRRGGPAGVPLAATVVAVPVAILAAEAEHLLFYTRFAIFGLVPVVLGLALGADGLAAAAARRVRRPALAPALLAAGLVAFQLLVVAQSRLLLTRPYAPTGDVARALAARTPPDPTASLRVGYGLGGGALKTYDPWVRYTHDPGGLRAAMREAQRSGRPLYVVHGYEHFNRRSHPEGFVLLDDPALFEEVERLYGIEGQFRHRILRWTGSPPPPAGERAP
jgi:hypothetical protein